MRHMAYTKVEEDTLMGWLRSVGSIKLQVSFAEYQLLFSAFLRHMAYTKVEEDTLVCN